MLTDAWSYKCIVSFQVTAAYDLSQMAKADAQMAYDEALKAKNISENARVDLETLLNNIRDFLQQDGATPSDIEAVWFLSLFVRTMFGLEK